jgi:hypothetical protein
MTHNLISSDRVEGTPVCRPTGEQIGVIQRVMIDKLSGQVAYAILTFGGFLGFGQKHFPVPWRSLKYRPRRLGRLSRARARASRAQIPPAAGWAALV